GGGAAGGGGARPAARPRARGGGGAPAGGGAGAGPAARARRVPLGVRKVGLIAARGQPIEVPDLAPDAPWLASPEWARREGIRAFGGQPLIHGGQVLGGLAVFFRTPLVAGGLLGLRRLAARGAAAAAARRRGGGAGAGGGREGGRAPGRVRFPAGSLPGPPGVRGAGRGRPGRDGRRLQGPPAQPGAPGGHQGGPPRRAGPGGGRGAVPPGAVAD